MLIRRIIIAIAAIAVCWYAYDVAHPPMSGLGDEGPRSAVIGNIHYLNEALQRYRLDHGGRLPATALFDQQLTLYTNVEGEPSKIKGDQHNLGPYMRKIPMMGLGPNKSAAVGASPIGWLYDETTGQVQPNCDPALLRPPPK
jgi:hypothetical protein